MKEYIELLAQDERLNDGDRVTLIYFITVAQRGIYVKLTNTEIVSNLQTDHATVNRRLRALEEAGYITRITTNESGRNKRMIRLDLKEWSLLFEVSSALYHMDVLRKNYRTDDVVE